MTYDEAIEKNNALLSEIQSLTIGTNVEDSDIYELISLAHKLKEYCEGQIQFIQSYTDNYEAYSQYYYLHNIVTDLDIILSTPAITQCDNGLNIVSEKLNSLNQELEFCKLCRAQSDVLDKMLLVEAHYQENGNEDQAIKNIRKLENLDLIHSNNPELSVQEANIQQLFKLYHQQIPSTATLNGEYTQDLVLPENIEELLNMEHSAISMIISAVNENFSMNNLNLSLSDTLSALRQLNDFYAENDIFTNSNGCVEIMANLSNLLHYNTEILYGEAMKNQHNNTVNTNVRAQSEHMGKQIDNISINLVTNVEISNITDGKAQLEKINMMAKNMPEFIESYTLAVASIATAPYEHRKNLINKLGTDINPEFENYISDFHTQCGEIVKKIGSQIEN